MDLEQRVQQLEAEVKELKATLQQIPMYHTARQQMLKRSQSMTPTNPHQEVPSTARPAIDWEQQIGRIWLPRIFVLVMIIGVLWAFIAAVANGWITENVRTLIGGCTGAIMYAFGAWQWRQRREALAQVLIGGSLAILMLSVAAAHLLYDLIPIAVALPLFILIVALNVGTGIRLASQSILIISAAAGFLTPFLLNTTTPNLYGFAIFELLFSLVLFYVSIRYRFLPLMIISPAMLYVSLLIAGLFSNLEQTPLVIAAVAFHLTMTLWALFSKNQQPTVFALIYSTFASSMLAVTIGDIPGEIYHWSLGLALIYATIGAYAFRTSAQAWIAVAFPLFTISLAQGVIDYGSDRSFVDALLLMNFTGGLIAGRQLRLKVQQWVSAGSVIIQALVIVTDPFRTLTSIETLNWSILMLALIVLYTLYRRDSRLIHNILLWSVAVYGLLFISYMTQALTLNLSSDLRGMTLSFVWLAYAVAVILFGFVQNKQNIRIAGLLFLGATLAKLIFFDIAGISMAVRSILFIVVGGVGIVLSRFFYRK